MQSCSPPEGLNPEVTHQPGARRSTGKNIRPAPPLKNILHSDAAAAALGILSLHISRAPEPIETSNSVGHGGHGDRRRKGARGQERKAGWITETAMRLQSGFHRLWAEQGCLRLQSVCVPAGGRRKKDEPACVSSPSKVTAAGDAETNPSFWSEDGSAGRKEAEVATLVIIRPAARAGAAEQKERDAAAAHSSESVPAGASDRA